MGSLADRSPLQGEIDRLSALCDQHELKFRSSKVGWQGSERRASYNNGLSVSAGDLHGDDLEKHAHTQASFEHRVFSEFPSVLGRLSDLDSRAEVRP